MGYPERDHRAAEREPDQGQGTARPRHHQGPDGQSQLHLRLHRAHRRHQHQTARDRRINPQKSRAAVSKGLQKEQQNCLHGHHQNARPSH